MSWRRLVARIGDRVLDRRDAPPETVMSERLETDDDVARRLIEHGARRSDLAAQLDELAEDLRRSPSAGG
jgi:hypothetical protein